MTRGWASIHNVLEVTPRSKDAKSFKGDALRKWQIVMTARFSEKARFRLAVDARDVSPDGACRCGNSQRVAYAHGALHPLGRPR